MNTLVIQSQWPAIEKPYNVLVLPSLQPLTTPIWPDTIPVVSQSGTGTRYIHDYLDCTITFPLCTALFHLPHAPWWYPFFGSTCLDAGTDSGIPGSAAIDWARILVQGESAPFFRANPTFSVLPCEIQTTGVVDDLSTGCFPPASADYWTLACENDSIAISWQIGTKSVGGGGGGGGGGAKDPPGPLGINLLAGDPLAALNPTIHGAPRPVTVGCGCGAAGESPEMELMATTNQPARAQPRNIIVVRRPLVLMKKGMAPVPRRPGPSGQTGHGMGRGS